MINVNRQTKISC